jgi:hypothetical protein
MIEGSATTALLAVALLTAGCRENSTPSASWVGTIDTLDDTVVVTTRSVVTGPSHSPFIADSISLVWTSEDLVRPVAIALVGDSLVAVLDRERLYVVTRGGSLVRALGRGGAGPGEFRRPRLLAAKGDTLYVYDEELQRLSDFAGTEGFSRSWSLPFPADFPNLANGGFRVDDSSMTAAWTSVMYLAERRPIDEAVVQMPFAGPTRVLARLTGPTYQMFGEGQVASVEMFGPKPIFALGRGGELAWSDGQRYCVNSSRSGQSMPTRICRDWTPVPVLDAARHPDLERLPETASMPTTTKTTITRMFDSQQSGGARNSLDQLLWDSEGRLWVRVIDSAQASVHPWLLDRFPDARPRYWVWNVFDRDGRYTQEVRLPSSFDLRVVSGGRGYGFAITPSGEPALGMVQLEGAR